MPPRMANWFSGECYCHFLHHSCIACTTHTETIACTTLQQPPISSHDSFHNPLDLDSIIEAYECGTWSDLIRTLILANHISERGHQNIRTTSTSTQRHLAHFCRLLPILRRKVYYQPSWIKSAIPKTSPFVTIVIRFTHHHDA